MTAVAPSSNSLRSRHARPRRVLPGFGLSAGITLLYLSLLVVFPLSLLAVAASTVNRAHLWSVIASPRALAAYWVSFTTAAAAAAINGPLGLLIAWVLARYRFAGRTVIDALVDLPFALPTAVSGIALTALYSERGWLGAPLGTLGIHVAYTRLGIVLALVFVGLPFVVRAVQPVLEEAERDVEEAALVLGANAWQRFRRVIFPALLPATVTGMTLAFARGIGEYGSVVFIAGNLPLKTEIAPLLIVTKIEEYDTQGAAAVALVLLTGSFLALFAINRIHRRCVAP